MYGLEGSTHFRSRIDGSPITRFDVSLWSSPPSAVGKGVRLIFVPRNGTLFDVSARLYEKQSENC